MPDFSVFIPESHRNISPGYVETLIQARREELFSGLMRLRYPSGETLVLSFLEGNQQRLYRCRDGTVEIIPRALWFDSLSYWHASAGYLHLSVEAMRFARLVYEAPVVREDTSSLNGEECVRALEAWNAAPDAAIVHLQTENLNRYYLTPGRGSPVIEELAFAEKGAKLSAGDSTLPRRLPGGSYRIARYVSNGEHELWREYELRHVFQPLTAMLFQRFSELAGRGLTERLCGQLSVWARESGWDISVTAYGAVNRHYFESLENAIAVYVDMLRRFRDEASLAIGARLVDGILQDGLASLDPYRRDLFSRYVYDPYGPGIVTGVVRR